MGKLTSVARRSLLLTLGVGLISQLSFAIPVCTFNTAYFVGTLGATGCTVGAVTFNNFDLTGSSELGTGVSPNAISGGHVQVTFTVVPIVGGAVLSVITTNDDLASWTLTGNQQFTLDLSYQISAPVAWFQSFGDSVTGSAGSLGGANTGLVSFDKMANSQNLASLGILGPSGTTTVSNGQTAFSGAPIGGLAGFTVVDNIQVRAGNANATLLNATNSFVVPEPMTSVLLGSGLLAFGLILRRRKKK
jgi:hypothetical protein